MTIPLPDTTGIIDCGFCEHRHGERYLCDPAMAMLAALKAEADGLNIEPHEFPKEQMGLGPNDLVMAQFTALAATVPVAGVHRPALVISGMDINKNQLPKWLYASTAQELPRVIRLVEGMVRLAIRTARAKNNEPPNIYGRPR